MEDRCICCGEIIPEGRQVCPICEMNPIITKERQSSMRYENKADMPQGMRQKVVPKMLAKVILDKADAKKKEYRADGILFHSKEQVERYQYLTKAAEYGYISNLRIWEKVQIQPGYMEPYGGREYKEITVAVPFSYSAGENRWPSDWVDSVDYAFWEALEAQANDGDLCYRAYEACGEQLPEEAMSCYKIFYNGVSF